LRDDGHERVVVHESSNDLEDKNVRGATTKVLGWEAELTVPRTLERKKRNGRERLDFFLRGKWDGSLNDEHILVGNLRYRSKVRC